MHRSLFVVLLAGTAVAIPAAQQRPPSTPAAEQPPITFRVDVNYVEIDAVVVDADGRPVRDLTRADFQLFEDGVPQTIEAFSIVNLPVERPDPPLYAASPVEPDVRSNRREFDGRIYLLILDDLNTHFARSARVRAAAREFLERHFGANDVAAVIHTGGARGGTQEFTSSRARLLRAVDAFMGHKSRSATLEKLDDYNRNRAIGLNEAPRDTSEAERAHNARRTLSSLKAAAEYLAGIRGRRKAVLFFSEGIDYDTTNAIQNRYASEILEDTGQAIASATRANVSFYTIDPRGLGGLAIEAMEASAFPLDNSIPPGALQQELITAQNSLRTLAEETGGFASVNRNEYSSAFARIVEEGSSYYMLGYSSSDARRDGRFRRVEVRVNRPGLRVRARNGYTAPRGRAAPPSRPASGKASPELRAAIDSPVPISGLGVTAFAGALRGTGNRASVLVVLEVDSGRIRFAEAGGVFSSDLEIVVIAVDDRGEVRDAGRDELNLRLRPQTHAHVLRTGLRVLRRLEVPPGRYQLRIGVRESNGGTLGTVLHDLDVPDFGRAPLSMSHVLVTSAHASHTPTPNPDPQLKDVLPASPAAVREFPAGDVLTAFAEVYDTIVRTPHRVSIGASVIADNGTTVFQRADERSSGELKGRGGGYGHTATIPLAGLAPGRYVLRMEARVLLADGATVSRELEFRIR